MADHFFDLSDVDRREALAVAADRLGRPAHLLEKDVWVVWTLQALFEHDVGTNLAFKGGTSLSKAYAAIRRFSEDVDLTYDIRQITPELTGEAPDPLPATKSQARKWTETVRDRLPRWLDETVQPLLQERLAADNLVAGLHRDSDTLLVEYPALAGGTGYVRPVVLLEFGARSTGEPTETRSVRCDAAPALPELAFPAATPRVMRAERTFWEKATAIHVYCLRGAYRGGDRYARHWSDLVALDVSGIADAALADRALAEAVAQHKDMFFAEKDREGNAISYKQAVCGGLRLVPEGEALDALARDYGRMIEDGLFSDDETTFDELMSRCEDLVRRANA